MQIGRVVVESAWSWNPREWAWSVFAYGFVCHGVELHAGPLQLVLIWPRRPD